MPNLTFIIMRYYCNCALQKLVDVLVYVSFKEAFEFAKMMARTLHTSKRIHTCLLEKLDTLVFGIYPFYGYGSHVWVQFLSVFI